MLPSTLASWLASATFALGCGAEPNTNNLPTNDAPAATAVTATATQPPDDASQPPADTARGNPVSSQGSQARQSTRTPITNPDGALLDTINRMVGSYPIGGVWGTPPAQLDFTPQDAPVEGELVVSRREGDLIQLDACTFGIEVPVAVALQTSDGALAESVEGTVLLTNQSDTTIDGTPAPFRAELSAVVDLGALAGSFAFADDATWTFGNAALRAELTPFGTRGMLGASIEPKQPPEPGSAVAPFMLEPLLTWDGGEGCVGSVDSVERALHPAPTEARAALDAALERVAAQDYRARYPDGAETSVTVELEPLTLLCATNFWASYWHFPTRAHLRTDDGRLDVSIGVAIDPGFTLVHYNSLTEVPWTYPPSLVPEQIGHIDVAVSDYAHVGIEAWFDLSPEPAGWIKVLGYDDGACGQCDAIGGCIECAFDARVEILSLFIGTQADNL